MQSETARIEAFSDGVFAIAITLLILDVKVPHPGQGSLAVALWRQWPSYFAFFLSFAFTGIMWINHHRMFTYIRKSDDSLLVLNLLLLFGVTAVPFPTEVLAEHLGGPGQKTAAVLYNCVYIVIGIFFNLLWRYAVSHRLLDSSVSGATAANFSRRYALGPLVYLLCLGLVWVDVRVSLGLSCALAIFFALPASLTQRQASSAHR
ncbi:MAG TPA: TMEM175 family protein [Candidatus Angelobacter sp.]|nr:TMEM175 family protein [Candidatus Angelobacter sp.]